MQGFLGSRLAMGAFHLLADVPYAGSWTMLSLALSVILLVCISSVALPMGIILILTGNLWHRLVVLAAFTGL